MTKVKLRVTRISDAELIQNCLSSQEAMLRNAPLFHGGESFLAKMTEALTPFADSTRAVSDTAAKLRALVSAKNAHRRRLESAYRYLANYVDMLATRDATVIPAAGMRGTNEPRPVHMTQVRELRLTPSVKEGELRARWKPVRRARAYEVQICKDTKSAPTHWTLKLSTTKARCSLNRDLVSGSKVWVRVRAIGARDEGAWSDVAWKTVP